MFFSWIENKLGNLHFTRFFGFEINLIPPEIDQNIPCSVSLHDDDDDDDDDDD